MAANAPLDFEITMKRYARLLVQNDSTAADAIEAGLGARCADKTRNKIEGTINRQRLGAEHDRVGRQRLGAERDRVG